MSFIIRLLFGRKEPKDINSRLTVRYFKVEEEPQQKEKDDKMKKSVKSDQVDVPRTKGVPKEPRQASATSELSEASENNENGEGNAEAQVTTSADEAVGGAPSKTVQSPVAVRRQRPIHPKYQEAIMEDIYRAYFPVQVRDHHTEEAPPVESFTPFFPPHTRPPNFSAIYVPPLDY